MARSTYFDLGRSADACPGSESGYAQRFQCGNIVKRRIWTRMRQYGYVPDAHRYYLRAFELAESAGDWVAEYKEFKLISDREKDIPLDYFGNPKP